MIRPAPAFAPAIALAAFLACAPASRAEPPSTAYVFPAGGQRGTTVAFKVGGLFLGPGCDFDLKGPGVKADKRIVRTNTLWFEGPLAPQPASQQKEDYPQDYAGAVRIDGDAPLGARYWRVSTSQGTTPLRKFVVGELPEIVENEIEGEPVPCGVELPVTINGRIFPREDVDLWTFTADAGQIVSCAVEASRIGSPLVPHLEVHVPGGRIIAENTAVPNLDPVLRFRAPADGRYELRISDADFRGNQDYVYRLTVTKGPVIEGVYPLGGHRSRPVDFTLFGANLPSDHLRLNLPGGDAALAVLRPRLGEASSEICVALDDLPEYVEEGTPLVKGVRRAKVPAVLNGRILSAGESDSWEIFAQKGNRLVLDLEASRLGSPLDSVLTILDLHGKRLANCDDMAAGQTDSRLTWQVPADGFYLFRVEDRLASRGGPLYAYRLRVDSRTPPADFQLAFKESSLNVERGKQIALPVSVDRQGDFRGAIVLSVSGLPAGVTARLPALPAGASQGEILFKADKKSKVTTADITIEGRATIDGKTVRRVAAVATDPRDPPIRQLALAVAVPTPFSFTTVYDQAYTPRGSVYVKHYHLERNGFRGPLEVCLADHQVRQRQGVTGPTIVVPADADAFDYPLTYAPFMEILRTSRTNLMATGIVKDADGRQHRVTFTTDRQLEQMVSVVAPGRLSLELETASMVAVPGGSSVISARLNRGRGLGGEVRLELVCPSHIVGVRAEPVRIPASSSAGKLTVRTGEGALGPFNMPLRVRATTIDDRGFPVTAEELLTVSLPR